MHVMVECQPLSKQVRPMVTTVSNTQVHTRSVPQMPRFQNGTSVANQMTKLGPRLAPTTIKKRLESRKDSMDDRPESAVSTRTYDGQLDALHRALRRKQHLLQRLKEQHLLEELNRPHTWGGSRRHYQANYITAPQLLPPSPPVAPTHIHQPAVPVPFLPPLLQTMNQPPHIIHQTLPQQPPTLIQQLQPQPPLITQISPTQAHPAPRSGSIKEDMMELMLMQNAQMHQIIMHNIMLKAVPPMVMSPPGGPTHFVPRTAFTDQDSYQGAHVFVRPDVNPKASAVYHHHHYSPAPTVPHLPPISYPAYPAGPLSDPGGHAVGHIPAFHHATAPVTLPPM